MKKKRLFMLALLYVTAQGAWAEAGDTADDPITINNTEEWNTFVSNVNSGTTYSGKFVRLDADISVTEMAGSSETNSFQGTFLGNDKTLTFTKGSSESAFGEENCAPFRFTNNATFQNLKVAGDIYTSRKFAAGLVAINYGTTTITNCRVSTVIHSNVSCDGTHGGIVAMPASGATTNITDCVYNGRLLTTNGTTYCGGFVGWSGNTTVTVTNSLYAPNTALPASGDETAIDNGATFVRGNSNMTINANCYYTEAMGSTQGVQVYATIPDGEIYKPVTVANTAVYLLCTVSNVTEYYMYTGSEIAVVPTVTCNGTTLAADTDYSVSISPNSTVQASGQYTMTITGSTGDYTGSKNISFKVVGPLSGTGESSTDPYLIQNAGDWWYFANTVNNGNSYSGKYVQLEADIDIDLPVGVRTSDTDTKPFSGTFLGNNKTIQVSLVSDGNSGLAPFRQISGATIKDLTVAGTISSSSYHTAGLVGFADGTNTIEHCIVGATLNINSNYAGGIIGHGLTSITTIKNCAFTGTIAGVGGNRYHVGVIWGWSTDAQPTLVNCLEAGTYTNIASMHPMGLQGGSGSISGCYFVTPQIGSPDNACTAGDAVQVYKDVLDNEISKKQMMIDGNGYYTPVVLSSVADSYQLSTGVSITPVLTDKDSRTLAFKTDYTVNLDGSEVNEIPISIAAKGPHTLTFTGTAGTYYGSKTVMTVVLEDGEVPPVTSSMTTLATGSYKVYYDLTLPARLTISGDVTLNLAEGVSLNAKKGIELSSGNSLTINGPGALTINGCDQSKSGIGAVNVGTLTINGGTINVQGGQFGAGIGGDRKNTGGGKITINGGIVNARGGQFGAGIGGGYDDKWGQYTFCGDIFINGGQVTAIGGQDASGIGPGYEALWIHDTSISEQDYFYNSGTLTLSWTTLDDFVNASSFENFGNSKLTRITIADGKQFIVGSTTIDKNTSDIFGKTNRKIIWAYGQGVDYTLNDGDSFIRTGDFPVNSATYQKTLGEDRVGKPQAWFVPFDYTIKEADTEKFDFYKINMIANAPNAQTDATDDIWVFLKKVDAGTMLHANMPYVYKPKEAVTDYAFTTENATLKAKATDARLTMMTAEDTYTLYGTYEPKTATAADPFYYVNIHGTLSYGDAVTVGAFRWIMRVESKFGNKPAYVRQMVFFDGENDETTDIQKAQWSIADGQSGIWYTLDGRKLDGKPSRAGVYIYNDKKVVIK